MNANYNNQQTTGAAGNGDALDKGIDYLERKAGHEQVKRLQHTIPTGFITESWNRAIRRLKKSVMVSVKDSRN